MINVVLTPVRNLAIGAEILTQHNTQEATAAIDAAIRAVFGEKCQYVISPKRKDGGVMYGTVRGKSGRIAAEFYLNTDADTKN